MALRDVLISIESFFEDCGASLRFWRSDQDSPSDILFETILRAIGGLNKKSIGVVIYCSVAKYFAEPSHASFICNQLDLRPSLCFDVSDGCMGWLTAMKLLDKSDIQGDAAFALIISHEFPLGPIGAIYPKCFEIRGAEDLSYKLPALTIGEATAVTLVNLEQAPEPLESARIELPRGSEFCSMPFQNYCDFLQDSRYIRESEQFHAYFREMSEIAARPSVRLIAKTIGGRDVILVTHSYTRSFERFARRVKLEANQVINYFSEYGNVAASTLPLNLRIASLRGLLAMNRPIFVWCASAGLKSAIMEIRLSDDFG